MAGSKKFLSDSLNNTLLKIVRLLHSYNINDWFIGYGTLLGIVRNNSCINMDDDVDIVLNIKQKHLLIKLIEDNKFKIVTLKEDFMKVVINDSIPPIDFYLATVDGSANFNDTWEKTTWSNVYPLLIRKWNDVNLFLPSNYISKLVNRYGNDWKIPKQSKGVFPKKTII